MLSFEGVDVNVLVGNPQVTNSLNPAHCQDLDIGALLRDVSVFWGVVFSDDEVRNFGSQVILMLRSHLLRLFGQCGLSSNRVSRSAQSKRRKTLTASQPAHFLGGGTPTLVSGGIDVQHKTTPRRGTEGSNAGRCGCEVIEAAGEGRAGPLEPLFASISGHERRERLRLREFEGI